MGINRRPLQTAMSAQLRSQPKPSAAPVEVDATQIDNPAWWAGHVASLKIVCATITDILDGRHPKGVIPNAPWEPVRRRLIEVVERARGNPAPEKAMRWTHVGDGLPERDGRYLIAYRTERGTLQWREATLIYGRWFCTSQDFDASAIEMWCQVELPEA